jgi:hypothetical protein
MCGAPRRQLNNADVSHRHPPACPGDLIQHRAVPGPPDEPGDDVGYEAASWAVIAIYRDASAAIASGGLQRS